MVGPANAPDAGSTPTWPEINRNPLDLMAWEYGPMGFGPRLVTTMSFMAGSPCNSKEKDRLQGKSVYPAATIANEAGVGVIAAGFATGDEFLSRVIRETLIDHIQNLLFRHARVLQTADLLAGERRQTLDAAMDDSLHRGIGESNQLKCDGFAAENIDLIRPGHFQDLLIGITRL